MSKRYLLAIDPGLATGVAIIDKLDPMEPKVILDEELQTSSFYVRMEDVFTTHGDDLEVVIEDFHMLSGDKSEAPWSLNLIGVTEYFCWKYKVEMTKQSPGRKPFSTTAKMKRVGFWHVGDDGHANDALKHALIYHVDQHPKWASKLLPR